ncbi:uncharacterized protein EV420DRAFT_1642437 [Desarmillaria tabescens]|uniref:Uncharacterized protein n=1 Tax=Armillaria tabescens TaxID=1929756 RepID=A0AA39N5B4_ARMTA|nr:uncharacterized protein EV420DRAFT_1642437 [Desarmillaria tabescens]KAK0458716.1 hypothetical protein EV420DRAFT_1642437 [Desarmillaria tabescens]
MPFPDAAKLSPQQFLKAMEDYKTYQDTVKARNFQIERWLQYHHKEANAMAKDADDPYNHFLARFTGQLTAKPRRQTPYNLWCEIHGKDIEQELETMVNQGELTEKQKPGRRQKMRSDRYRDLSEEERDEWLQRSEQEHATAMEAWRAGGDGKVPDDPLDIQN